MKAKPDGRVIDWIDKQAAGMVWTTSISVFEIHFGLNILPNGKRKKALQTGFETMLTEDLEQRILDFDIAAAVQSAEISAALLPHGLSVEIRDLQIAGIVAAKHGALVTRNIEHFQHMKIPLINPWE